MFDWFVTLLGPTPFDAVSNPHPYPMIRSGGIFLIFIGVGMVIGSLRDNMNLRIVGLGVALTFGAILYNATALDLIYTMGTPTGFQNALLGIAVNIAAIGMGIWSFFIHGREGSSRRFMAGLLVILNLSFLIMIPAQGWVLALMATVCIAWALRALRGTTISINRVWLVDGLLKIAAGLVMVIFYPV